MKVTIPLVNWCVFVMEYSTHCREINNNNIHDDNWTCLVVNQAT